MAKLYFMDLEFEAGYFSTLDLAIEGGEVPLLFGDSWYWLHYCFFGRDAVCSEDSDALRTHLLNLVAMFYKHHDHVLEQLQIEETDFDKIVQELLAIVEASRDYPICLWIYGDETCKAFLGKWRAGLPSVEQMQKLLDLPHFFRTKKERLHYRYIDDKMALKRYRNELASFNQRKKLAKKNRQRETRPLRENPVSE